MTTPKGYWLEVHLVNGDVHKVTGISSQSEAFYLMKRRYSTTPNLDRVFLFVGTKRLATMQGGKDQDMSGLFATFDAANPVSDFRPWAKADTKERLVAFAIPFTIVGVSEPIESTFTNAEGDPQYYYNFDIDLDTSSTAYKYVSANFEIEPAYSMSMSAGVKRTQHVERLIRPKLQEGKTIKCKLIKQGRGVTFADAE